jgi:N-methylhydantoinase B
VLKLMRAGKRNEDVWRLNLANARIPDLLEGDLHAQVASGELGARRLVSVCHEHGLTNIDGVAEEIIRRSEHAMRSRIRELQSSRNTAETILDLADGSEIKIVASVEIDSSTGDIVVDYRGSSPASRLGINIATNYAFSYTAFVVRSIFAPDIPNNAGSLLPIRMVTEPGSIVDAQPPMPVTARHVVAMLLPMPIMKALSTVVPGQITAEGAGVIWSAQVRGRHADGTPFTSAGFGATGGTGARATKPGLTATGFPTGIASAPLEILEAQSPIRFLRKEIHRGSGGAGKQRGGDGQLVQFTVDTGEPWLLDAVVGRLRQAPQGVLGGADGHGGRFSINGEPVRELGTLELSSGDVVEMILPGGGGYGPPD